MYPYTGNTQIPILQFVVEMFHFAILMISGEYQMFKFAAEMLHFPVLMFKFAEVLFIIASYVNHICCPKETHQIIFEVWKK